ncbi:MAG: hypothetical protein QM674_18785 [Burkholderiaceae bacterium]
MSTQELSSIALRVVGQYQEAGRSLVNAYRNGAQRVIDRGVAPLEGKSHKVSEFLSSRLKTDTDRVASLIDSLASVQTRGIEGLASSVTKVEQTGAVAILDMFAKLQLPQAKFSEQIAVKVAEGAKSIEARSQKDASADVKADAEAEAKPARRAARSAE